MAWGIWLALGLSFIVFYILLRMVGKIMPLILHGIAGMAMFWALNSLGMLNIPLDWVTFLIGALGGIFGVIIVLVLAALHVPM